MRKPSSQTRCKFYFISNNQFDIQFECTKPIQTFVKWEVVYIGSAKVHEYDQILTTAHVGPIEVGMNRFILIATPPKIESIPFEELALTVVMLKAYYNDQEFIRISYYVQNELPPEATGVEQIDPTTIERSIDVENITVRNNRINWK
ncbi:Histone chaperone, putative [Trichomonas vaginalis G3]|uniref:Histone chaperone, putative n=1 Tax=Trichomonas vaginalis (strain ATCC PRA-98 / G3) TaxID=412133 RepID=A2D752_TRIV3|nr:Histone chaperone, putative [Trichomonas vaginalis G3]|eukprot:XP_001276817.1 Histone chaperone [Trichomonas vaginalis G3]